MLSAESCTKIVSFTLLKFAQHFITALDIRIVVVQKVKPPFSVSEEIDGNCVLRVRGQLSSYRVFRLLR